MLRHEYSKWLVDRRAAIPRPIDIYHHEGMELATSKGVESLGRDDADLPTLNPKPVRSILIRK